MEKIVTELNKFLSWTTYENLKNIVCDDNFIKKIKTRNSKNIRMILTTKNSLNQYVWLSNGMCRVTLKLQGCYNCTLTDNALIFSFPICTSYTWNYMSNAQYALLDNRWNMESYIKSRQLLQLHSCRQCINIFSFP